ncbi:MAG: septum formation initiator family protein [Candidatus Omnitrophota bacterium]
MIRWKKVAVWLVLMAVYLPGFLRLTRSSATLRYYRQQIPLISYQNRFLKNEIAQLRTDPFLTEVLARQELGLIKDGERVVRIVRVAAPSPRYPWWTKIRSLLKI